jgi:hypothetical protein
MCRARGVVAVVPARYGMTNCGGRALAHLSYAFLWHVG